MKQIASNALLLFLVLQWSAAGGAAKTIYVAPAAAPAGAPAHDSQAADFQTALDSAALGDTIVLQADHVYRPATGPSFLLRNKSAGTGWITIQSSSLDSLPAANYRVKPQAHQSSMPKLMPIEGSDNKLDSIVATEPGAHHYRFVGIEFTTGRFLDHLVRLGSEIEPRIPSGRSPTCLTLSSSIAVTSMATRRTDRAAASP